MAYGDLKDLARRTVSNKVLRDKAFNIVKKSKYGGYQRDLVSMGYTFFDKKTSGSGITTRANKSAFNNEIEVNNWLKNYTNQLLENLKTEQLILHLKKIFGVLI